MKAELWTEEELTHTLRRALREIRYGEVRLTLYEGRVSKVQIAEWRNLSKTPGEAHHASEEER